MLLSAVILQLAHIVPRLLLSYFVRSKFTSSSRRTSHKIQEKCVQRSMLKKGNNPGSFYVVSLSILLNIKI